MKFHQKAVEVDAVQFTQAMIEAHLFDRVPLPAGVRMRGANYHRERREIHWSSFTVTGTEQLEPGDWIVTDQTGSRGVLRADEFEATYESSHAAGFWGRMAAHLAKERDDALLKLIELQAKVDVLQQECDECAEQRDASRTVLEVLRARITASKDFFTAEKASDNPVRREMAKMVVSTLDRIMGGTGG